MDRHIGIVVGEDGAAAGVGLIRQGGVLSVESAFLYPPGRVFSSAELDQALKLDRADRVAVGSWYARAVVVEMQVPEELSAEEAMGVVRYQLGSQVPLPESDVICHARRIAPDSPSVKVVAIPRSDWEGPLERLAAAGVETDILTSPLMAGDCGIADSRWRVPEFESEFIFTPSGIVTADGSDPVWTPEMSALIAQANEKISGNGRKTLLPAAIQMALLSLSGAGLLMESVNEELPVALRPKRHLWAKWTAMILLCLSVLLAGGLVTKVVRASMWNSRNQRQFNAKVIERQQRVDQDKAVITYACDLADEGLKALGKPNRIFTLLSRLGMCLPQDIYIESLRANNDGSIQLVIKGASDEKEFRDQLASLNHFVITALTNETQRDGGVVFRVTLQVKES